MSSTDLVPIDIEEYRKAKAARLYANPAQPGNGRERRERRAIQSNLRKGISPMRYLPISYTKKLTDFPCNPDLVEAGLAPLEMTVKTKMRARDLLAFSDLASVEKLDEKGNPVGPQYDPAERTLKMIASIILSWNLTDYDTGQVVPVTPEAVGDLLDDDFAYLSKEFGAIMDKSQKETESPAEAVGEVAGEGVAVAENSPVLEALEPKTAITEEEKN